MKLFKCNNCGWIGQEDEFMIQSLDKSNELYCPLCESSDVVLEKYIHDYDDEPLYTKKKKGRRPEE